MAAYSVPLFDCSGFVVVGQSSTSVAAPFLVTYVRLVDDGSVDKVQVAVVLSYVSFVTGVTKVCPPPARK